MNFVIGDVPKILCRVPPIARVPLVRHPRHKAKYHNFKNVLKLKNTIKLPATYLTTTQNYNLDIEILFKKQADCRTS